MHNLDHKFDWLSQKNYKLTFALKKKRGYKNSKGYTLDLQYNQNI